MEQKYKYITNLVDKNTCLMLSNELRSAIKNNKAANCTQVAGSFALRDFPLFDELLEKCLPVIESHVNKKLFPTYAFARFYEKGQVLEPHDDREACEYSATITLDFYGHNPDPIFVAEIDKNGIEEIILTNGKKVKIKNKKSINIDVGDGLIYKGREIPHWRNPIENEYQSQIFLHYVDAEGEFADWKYDKREKLSHHGTRQTDIQYWYVPNAISDAACDSMIEKFEQLQTEKAEVGSFESARLDLNVRDVNKIPLPFDVGIGATLAGIALLANSKAWKFDVTHQNQSEYLKYDLNGHYVTHMDTGMNPENNETRKLTVLAFLNDDFEGGKLYIKSGDQIYYPPQSKGTVLIFPSFLLHGVEPITSGIRRSIVTWMVGPWFK